MASEVDICNAALAHLGDAANVASISPPDGSMQAEYCSKHYPQARDSLLEMHDWGFATTFASLAALENTSTWGYAYARPAELIKVLGIVQPGMRDSLFAQTALEEIQAFGRTAWMDGLSHGFAVGQDAIYSNRADATFAYTRRVTDTTKFSPLFVRALGWLLASDLAGVILKGKAGEQATVSCLRMAQAVTGWAAVSDANAQSTRATYTPSWILGR